MTLNLDHLRGYRRVEGEEALVFEDPVGPAGDPYGIGEGLETWHDDDYDDIVKFLFYLKKLLRKWRFCYESDHESVKFFLTRFKNYELAWIKPMLPNGH
jgi:hypothetical protein